MTNYGTNNPAAWEPTCTDGKKHVWVEVDSYRGKTQYRCRVCGARTTVET